MDFVTHYERATNWIVAQCPPPDKFAHMCAGLAIWLLAAVLLKRKLSTPWPLAAVALCALANEYMDTLAHGSWRWHDSAGDLLASLVWPCAITLALRLRPAIRG